MATSKLRELLQVLEKQGIKEYTPASYALLEALVDELEAQRPPEVDARIVTLTAKRNSWERQCRNAERGLADAKAEIDRLRKARDDARVDTIILKNSRDYWEKRCLDADYARSSRGQNHETQPG